MISYPDALHDWVREEFSRLKQRQGNLLGIDEHERTRSPYMRLLYSKL